MPQCRRAGCHYGGERSPDKLRQRAAGIVPGPCERRRDSLRGAAGVRATGDTAVKAPTEPQPKRVGRSRNTSPASEASVIAA